MASAEREKIDWTDETDRMHWLCPEGHRDWEPTNGHFWCATCARMAKRGADVDPVFYELHNGVDGELYDREEIQLKNYKHTN